MQQVLENLKRSIEYCNVIEKGYNNIYIQTGGASGGLSAKKK